MSELWGPHEFVEHSLADGRDIAFTSKGEALNGMRDASRSEVINRHGPHVGEVAPGPACVLVEGEGSGSSQDGSGSGEWRSGVEVIPRVCR